MAIAQRPIHGRFCAKSPTDAEQSVDERTCRSQRVAIVTAPRLSLGLRRRTISHGDALPDLVRLERCKPLIVRGIWLLVLPELRRNATVRKVLDWIAAVTKHDAHALLGSAPQATPGTAFLQDDLAAE